MSQQEQLHDLSAGGGKAVAAAHPQTNVGNGQRGVMLITKSLKICDSCTTAVYDCEPASAPARLSGGGGSKAAAAELPVAFEMHTSDNG